MCPKNVLKWLFVLRNLLIGLDRLITVSTSEIEGGEGDALSPTFVVLPIYKKANFPDQTHSVPPLIGVGTPVYLRILICSSDEPANGPLPF